MGLKDNKKSTQSSLLKTIKMREDVHFWLIKHKDRKNKINSISDVIQVLIDCYDEDFDFKIQTLADRRDIIEQLGNE